MLSKIPLNIGLSRQCYDGASNMSGCRSGIAKQITDLESRALYTHCYGHSLNLAVGDTVKRIKVLRDVMDITYEISGLPQSGTASLMLSRRTFLQIAQDFVCYVPLAGLYELTV